MCGPTVTVVEAVIGLFEECGNYAVAGCSCHYCLYGLRRVVANSILAKSRQVSRYHREMATFYLSDLRAKRLFGVEVALGRPVRALGEEGRQRRFNQSVVIAARADR
ncbi:hypothetical protein PSYRMG_04690 [Pseudomonas syringae UMAF0158]|nr:hypothetical protein PSYRMG_04690 [Pseudomonas syringae UMAF0158]